MPGVRCSCGERFDAAPGDAICPSCGAVHTVAEERLRAACDCGAKIAVPARLAGKLVKCPKCGQPVRVPASADAPIDLAPSPETAPPEPIERTAPRDRALPPPKPEGWRMYGRWALAAALLPLVLSIFAGPDDTKDRWDRTVKDLKDHPEVMSQLKKVAEKTGELTKKAVISSLPGRCIEGAFLPYDTMAHWLYALLSAAAFWGFILLVYPMGNATSKQLWTVGIFTGTIGIFLLLALQWAAFATQGTWVRGGGKLAIFFYFIKFIGFSYSAALGDTNFLLSMFGFTFGVGLCEELCKILPLFWHYRKKATLDLRGAVVWGLASGIGFGVSEGITYSSGHYNGFSTGGIYIVRFVSCVALHAIWTAASAVLLWRRQAEIDGIESWYDWFIPLFKVLGISMLLHALYDTALKKDMEAVALVTAVASFAWFFWLYERARKHEPAFLAGATA